MKIDSSWSHSLMVRIPAFQAGDTGFESRWDHMAPSSNGLGRQPLKLQMLSSNLAGVTVTIVQRLVRQIVALKIRVQLPVATLPNMYSSNISLAS